MNLGTGAFDLPPATSPPSLFGGLTVDVSTAGLADWLGDFEPALATVSRLMATSERTPIAVLRHPVLGGKTALGEMNGSLEVSFLGRPSRIATRGQLTTVDTPARGLRMTFGPSQATVSGEDFRQVGLSAGVLAAAWYAERAREAGWHVVHASCFELNGRGFLCLGAKGSGKSTLALTAATRCGAQLLANDHCLVRVVNGTVVARSLPQAVSVGFGLLSALGWSPVLSAALLRRSMRHPSIRGPRLEAIRHGRSVALRNKEGSEVKVPLLTGELRRLFDIRTVAETVVAATLYPSMGAAVPSHNRRPPVNLTATDMFANEVGGAAAVWLRPAELVTQENALPLPAWDIKLTNSVDAVAETIHRLAEISGQTIVGKEIQ